MDTFGRTVDYLRISVTDRCNERCRYCRPEGYETAERRPGPLTAEQILRVVRVAVELGFRNFRLTGGEPLARRDLPRIVAGMARTRGLRGLGLSTNAAKLAALARPLREAGLGTVNISLDALNPALYHHLSGGSLAPVLAGIRAAVAAGFECVKLNTVLMRGLNEQEIWPLVLFAAEHRLPLRFIELMPVTTLEVLSGPCFFSVADAKRLLSQRDELVAAASAPAGWGPAKYYRLRQTGAVVGFIAAMTERRFCETCNRVRLTADGRIRPCLGQPEERDLRACLRDPASDDAIRTALAAAIAGKPLRHSFCRPGPPGRPMVAIGG